MNRFLIKVTRLLLFLVSLTSWGAKIHVAKTGNDSNIGSFDFPVLTVNKANALVLPGDSVVIHGGTYREYVNPIVSGTVSGRITYVNSTGETVYLKGSEQINSWVQNVNGTWTSTIPNSLFGTYNPYALLVNGDYQNYGNWHHRGDVYLNNNVLNEVKLLSHVELAPYTWFAFVNSTNTIITANFASNNPNQQLTEINVRELIFFPTTNNIDFITVDGIRFLHAAPNWQAPNTGPSDPNPLTQVGAIGSKMGKGWEIKNCEVAYSKTAGIMMGETPDDALNQTNINAFGDHIITNNVIHDCGEYGIAGQKGLTRSLIKGNRIEDINKRNEFGGYETAGIKIWNCTDVLIEGNLINNVLATTSATAQAYCLWIDYANQGTRITRNFFIGGATTTVFIEANFGPTLFDNNIVVGESNDSFFNYSGGTIFAHNLFINTNFDFQTQDLDGNGTRQAYTVTPHTLTQSGFYPVNIVHNKMYNNIFAGAQGPINFGPGSGTGNQVANNLYLDGTAASPSHTNSVVDPFNLDYTVVSTSTGLDFTFSMNNSYSNVICSFVNNTLIGTIPLANQTIEDKDGNAITLNYDFNSNSRIASNPVVGPIETLVSGSNAVSIGCTILPTSGTNYDVPGPFSNVVPQAPFNTAPLVIPGVVESEQYDFGGPEVSYHDNEVKDGDLTQRPDDYVDLAGDGLSGLVVAWFDTGDWMEYTVNVAGGTYAISVSATSGIANPGSLTISLDGNVLGSVDINATGSWSTYQLFTLENINIPASNSGILRFTSANGGSFNFDKVTFSSSVNMEDKFDLDPIRVFPNPVQNELHISSTCNFEVSKIEVFDLMSVKVLESVFGELIDVSQLPQGMYLLKINDQLNGSFIKE